MSNPKPEEKSIEELRARVEELAGPLDQDLGGLIPD